MAFIDHLREFGAPTDGYLKTGKLPTLCEDSDCLVPVDRMYQFLAEAARNEGPFLGWDVGGKTGDHQFSTKLRSRLHAAPTLLSALQSLANLIRSESSGIELGIVERQVDIVFFTRYPRLRAAPGYEIAQSYQLSVFISLVQAFLGKNWRPAEIGMESQQSTPMMPEQFQGSCFNLNGEFGYFTVPRSCLHRAMADGQGRSAADQIPGLDQLGELALMGNLLRSYLADGYVSQASAAELLDTSVRSLSRRLSEHGTTYLQFMDGLRFNVAKEHLKNPDLQILDVANAVGFSDQGDFTRMFRRVSGMTPRSFRRTVCASWQ